MNIYNNVISICMAWSDTIMDEAFTSIAYYDNQE